MSDSLLVKLNSQADANNLLKVGEFVVKVTNVVNKSVIAVNASKSIKMRIVGDGNFFDYSTETNLGKEITTTANVQRNLKLSAGSYEIHYESDYAINNLNLSNVNGMNSVSNYEFLNSAQRYNPLSGGDYGGVNLAGASKLPFNTKELTSLTLNYNRSWNTGLSLVALPDLTTLKINNCLVSDDIVNLSACTKLTAFEAISCTGLHGNLEDLLDAIASTRTSGTMSIKLNGSNVKYNNAAITGTLTATFSAGGWSVS